MSTKKWNKSEKYNVDFGIDLFISLCQLNYSCWNWSEVVTCNGSHTLGTLRHDTRQNLLEFKFHLLVAARMWRLEVANVDIVLDAKIYIVIARISHNNRIEPILLNSFRWSRLKRVTKIKYTRSFVMHWIGGCRVYAFTFGEYNAKLWTHY